MLVTRRQMQQAEESAFAAGVNAADLMEQAGCGIAAVVRQFFPEPGTLIAFLGSGNNAGDALVAARELERAGWQCCARLSSEPERMKPLPLGYLRALPNLKVLVDAPERNWWKHGPLVLLDGLLGIGAIGEMRPAVRALAAEMNALRLSHHAVTVAMDIPSGLDADTGLPDADCVIADVTASVAQVKAGLLADAAISHVGRIALVPLPEISAVEGDRGALALTPGALRAWLPRRMFDFHKGQAGRVGIIAGSRGFLGAAVLACLGALRAGAGLVALLVKEDAYALLAAMVPPEVMVRPVKDYREALEMRFDALAIGPGLGFAAQDEYLAVLRAITAPVIADADALTAMAGSAVQMLRDCSGPRLLTPHPGEMARLCGSAPALLEQSRREQAETFAALIPGHTLLLKGARTVIATQGMPTLFNTTGHPGMATGGMGDVLTGVCGALAAQGIPLHRSAGLAAWFCGRSAELSAMHLHPHSVLPTDVASHLGMAMHYLERGWE